LERLQKEGGKQSSENHRLAASSAFQRQIPGEILAVVGWGIQIIDLGPDVTIRNVKFPTS